MISRIHVNKNTILSNLKHGRTEPPISVRRYRDGNKTAHEVEYTDEARIIVDGVVVARVKYRPSTPLECGAKVWIETEHEVRV